MIVHPTAQISPFLPYLLCDNVSGAMKYGVPTKKIRKKIKCFFIIVESLPKNCILVIYQYNVLGGKKTDNDCGICQRESNITQYLKIIAMTGNVTIMSEFPKTGLNDENLFN